MARIEGTRRKAVSPSAAAAATAIERARRVASGRSPRSRLPPRKRPAKSAPTAADSGWPARMMRTKTAASAATARARPRLVAASLDEKEHPRPEAEDAGLRIQDPRGDEGEGQREGDRRKARRARRGAELARPEPHARGGQEELDGDRERDSPGERKEESRQGDRKEHGRDAVGGERRTAAVPAVAPGQRPVLPGQARRLRPGENLRRDVVQVRVERRRTAGVPGDEIRRVVERKRRRVRDERPRIRQDREQHEAGEDRSRTGRPRKRAAAPTPQAVPARSRATPTAPMRARLPRRQGFAKLLHEAGRESLGARLAGGLDDDDVGKLGRVVPGLVALEAAEARAPRSPRRRGT